MDRCTQSVKRPAVLVPLLAALLGGCAGPLSTQQSPTPAIASGSPAPADRFDPAAAAQTAPGGCGATKVYLGGVPPAIQAAAGYAAPVGLRYAIADDGSAAGFLFADQLRATAKPKILWVMHVPRAGEPLLIDAHPVGAATPVVSLKEPPDSAPGEIYPSIVDVPFAGCWVLTLRWAGHTATLALEYAAP